MKWTIVAIALLAFLFYAPFYFDQYTISNYPNVLHYAKQGSFFNYNGFAIFYSTWNFSTSPLLPKEVVLLLHGFPTSSYDFQDMMQHPLVKEMNQEIQSTKSKQLIWVTLDLLGYGFSSKPKHHTYTLEEQTDIVKRLLLFLQLDHLPIHILTHDVSVSIVQELLAQKLVEKKLTTWNLKSISFLNGGLFPAYHKPILLQTLLSNPIIAKIWDFNPFPFPFGLFTRSMRSILGPKSLYSVSEKTLEEWYSCIVFNEGHRIVHKLLSYISDRKRNQQRYEQALCKAAVVNSGIALQLINGPADPVSGAHLVTAFKEKVITTNLYGKVNENIVIQVLSDEIGHYPHIESLETVLQYYLSFLLQQL